MRQTLLMTIFSLLMAGVAYPAAGPPKSPQLYAIEIEYGKEAEVNLQIKPFSKNGATLLIVDHQKKIAYCFAELTEPTLQYVASVTGINRLELASVSLSVTANLYDEAIRSATNPDLFKTLGAPDIPAQYTGCMPGDTIPPMSAGLDKLDRCINVTADPEEADRKVISENYFGWQTVVLSCFLVSGFTTTKSDALKQQVVQGVSIWQQISRQPGHDPYMSWVVEFYYEPADIDLVMEAPSGMYESTTPNSIVSWRADIMQLYGCERSKHGESDFRRSRMSYYSAGRGVIAYLLEDNGRVTFCQDGGVVNYADMFFYDKGFYPGNSCVFGASGAGKGIAYCGRVLAHEIGHSLFGFPDTYTANCPPFDYQFGVNRVHPMCDNDGLMGKWESDWFDIHNVEACAGWTDNDANGILDAACPATGYGALIVGVQMYEHITIVDLANYTVAFLYVTPQNTVVKDGKLSIIWDAVNFYRNSVSPDQYTFWGDKGSSGRCGVTYINGTPWILEPTLVKNRFVKLMGWESYRRGVLKDSAGTAIMWIPTDELMTVDSCDLGKLQKATYRFEVSCWHPAGNISTLYSFQFQISWLTGDANGDDLLGLADVITMVNYIFRGAQLPVPLVVLDVNCNGTIALSDIIYMINYIYRGGSAPCPGG